MPLQANRYTYFALFLLPIVPMEKALSFCSLICLGTNPDILKDKEVLSESKYSEKKVSS